MIVKRSDGVGLPEVEQAAVGLKRVWQLNAGTGPKVHKRNSKCKDVQDVGEGESQDFTAKAHRVSLSLSLCQQYFHAGRGAVLLVLSRTL